MTVPLLSLLLLLAASPTPSSAEDLLSAPEDAALLRALLAVFEPSPIEIRVLHIENLGLLDDPRALDALASLALESDQQIAQAAVRAVGALSAPRAEEILTNIVRHPNLTQALKKSALEQLVHQRGPGARAFLADVAQNRTYPVALQHVAQSALQHWGPAPGAASRSQK